MIAFSLYPISPQPESLKLMIWCAGLSVRISNVDCKVSRACILVPGEITNDGNFVFMVKGVLHGEQLVIASMNLDRR